MKTLPIGLVALVLSVPVWAQAPAQTSVPRLDKAEPDRIVCERQEQLGSRIAAKKVCLTVRQWQEFRSANREETERVQQSANMTKSN